MLRPTVEPDWQTMVLRSMPKPAWLAEDAPESDVVISTRVRYARNLVGHRFPHHAEASDLLQVRAKVIEALNPRRLVVRERITEAEREFMVGARLLAPDFEMDRPGRAMLHDASGELSVMVNEEDHVRVQGLQAGWQLKRADQTAVSALAQMRQSLSFAHAEPTGFLTASPFNAGSGRRASVLLHLVGLAHTKRLPDVLKAAAAVNLVVRGVFGESTRGVGAFLQVSWTGSAMSPFVGAVTYLIAEERLARSQVESRTIRESVRSAAQFAVSAYRLELSDVLRVLAYARWAGALGIPGLAFTAKDVDFMASKIELHGRYDAELAAKSRADQIRFEMESLLSAVQAQESWPAASNL